MENCLNEACPNYGTINVHNCKGGTEMMQACKKYIYLTVDSESGTNVPIDRLVMPVFDLEAVYDEEISPLIKQIIEICKQHEMPMVASFCYRRDEEGGNDAANTNLPFGDRQPERLLHAGNAIYGNYDEKQSFTTAITVMKA